MGMLLEDNNGGGGGSKEESCITELSLNDNDEEEKAEKIISYLVEEHEKDEAFRKNPYMCEHSVDHYYYLLPRAKRSKTFRRNKPPTSTSQKKGMKIRISLKRKTIEIVDKDERNKTETLLDEKQSKLEDREKKRRKMKPIIDPPGLPDELKEKVSRMGVQISQVKLVIQKVLYDTDLSYKHMRMSIPVNQVRTKDFLTPQQKMVLETRDTETNKKTKIEFYLIEPSLEETKIHLAKWDMNSSSNYVLLNGWMKIVEKNNLKSGRIVQLWSFDKDLVPWLALVLVPPPYEAAMERG